MSEPNTFVEPRKIRVGVSACLIGAEVRFNGGHKRQRFLTDRLAQYIDWYPVCPEMELGLGTPREAIRLVQIDERIQLKGSNSTRDLTSEMQQYSDERVEALAKLSLRGFVLKKDSPSCGMERVKVYSPSGSAVRTGRGIFADTLIKRFPNMPVEEEGRLSDPRLRENWVNRVFAYDELSTMWESNWSLGDLVEFHTRHKFMLLSHSEQIYRELGRLVARAKSVPRDQLRSRYENAFMNAMKLVATTKKNINVLQHIVGFFKRRVDSQSRQDLHVQIEDYRAGLVPLSVPLTLIKHYVQALNCNYLKNQTFLNPHPKDLALRNNV